MLGDKAQPEGADRSSAVAAHAGVVAALGALAAELRDLEAGCQPGAITAPKKAGGRPPNPETKFLDQARLVLAYEWLQFLGVRPKQAAVMVASATGGKSASDVDRVEQLAADFKRPGAIRQPAALAQLWDEVETAERSAYGRSIVDAGLDHVIVWLQSVIIEAPQSCEDRGMEFDQSQGELKWG